MRIKEETSFSSTIEKSRFIAYLKPIFNEEEYKEYLKIIKKKYYDASHVCSALICNNIKRSNDDGEPSGTAGVPILNVLEKNNLDNTCALVVRYFGGIKLGAGGLIRAYSNITSETIKIATIIEDIEYPKYQIKLTYETSNKLDNFFLKNTLFLNKEYSEEVIITYVLKEEKDNEKIIEITKSIKPLLIGKELVQKVIK